MAYIQQSELSENNYANITEVKADNAIKRGWVPSIIPNSAYNILEKHSIDINKFEGSFNYLEKDEATFLSNLQYVNGRYIWDYFKFEIDKKQNKVIFTSLTENDKQKIFSKIIYLT